MGCCLLFKDTQCDTGLQLTRLVRVIFPAYISGGGVRVRNSSGFTNVLLHISSSGDISWFVVPKQT